MGTGPRVPADPFVLCDELKVVISSDHRLLSCAVQQKVLHWYHIVATIHPHPSMLVLTICETGTPFSSRQAKPTTSETTHGTGAT